MAQFVQFEPNVEVNGETILASVHSFPSFMQFVAMKILEYNGIKNPCPGYWYSQQSWLNVIREMSEKYGTNTIFEIGKAVPEKALFPSNIESVDEAIASIDILHKMNHRNGDAGFYELVDRDYATQKITVHSKTPYPCDYDRGLITAIARKFKKGVVVEVDQSRLNRSAGCDDAWYIVSYC